MPLTPASARVAGCVCRPERTRGAQGRDRPVLRPRRVTARAERWIPRMSRGLLSSYYARVRAELERFGGTVEKFVGDAVMAVFGAPVAHEDDPERAVRAALAIRDGADGGGQRARIRIGVHTGEALVALDARPDERRGAWPSATSSTPPRGCRSAAPVNGVLVGEATFRATEQRDRVPARSRRSRARARREPLPAWEAVSAPCARRRGRRAGAHAAARRPRAELDAAARGTRRGRARELPAARHPRSASRIGKSRLIARAARALDTARRSSVASGALAPVRGRASASGRWRRS